MNNKAAIRHLAIIPDGNRRWAKKHLIRVEKEIYKKGAEKASEIIETAFQAGIACVTFWASSYANLSMRTPSFITSLEDMYRQKIKELADHPFIRKEQVKIEVYGAWRTLLKPKTIETIEYALRITAHHKNLTLVLLIGYDGRLERGEALQSLIKKNPATSADAKEADRLLRTHSWTGHLPDVDLIVRTGAWEDPHLSAAFLNLLTAESQLCFPSVLWPDFTPELLRDIIADFQNRERRLGK